jgi:hypothetical protein
MCLARATTHATLGRALQSVNRSAPGGRISLALTNLSATTLLRFAHASFSQH